MMQVEVSIRLLAFFCNSWPQLRIIFNNNIIYNDYVVDTVTINLKLDCNDLTNYLILEGIGKTNGENGIWDTKLSLDGSIQSDKKLLIEKITFNQIDMGECWIKSLPFKNLDQSIELGPNNGFYKNGSIEIQFYMPLYEWIIESKYIKNTNQQSGIYNGGDKFNYESLRSKMFNLQSLLND